MFFLTFGGPAHAGDIELVSQVRCSIHCEFTAHSGQDNPQKMKFILFANVVYIRRQK